MKQRASYLVPFLPLAFASGCFSPDVDAIETKMREECRLAPEGPLCACTEANSDSCHFTYERFVEKRVQSAREHECLLAVDCSDPARPGVMDEIIECTSLDEPINLEGTSGEPDPECLQQCAIELSDCGSDTECGVVDVEACYRQHDECKRKC